MLWPSGSAYFFCGDQYVKYDPATDTVPAGYPAAIAGAWPGLPFAAAPPGSVVIEVIPLLVETGLHQAFDHVIVVDAPTEVQVRRLMQRSGLTADQARTRVRIQANREDRIAAADWVIDNSGDQASTVRQVEDLWPVLQQLSGSFQGQTGS